MQHHYSIRIFRENVCALRVNFRRRNRIIAALPEAINMEYALHAACTQFATSFSEAPSPHIPKCRTEQNQKYAQNIQPNIRCWTQLRMRHCTRSNNFVSPFAAQLPQKSPCSHRVHAALAAKDRSVTTFQWFIPFAFTISQRIEIVWIEIHTRRDPSTNQLLWKKMERISDITSCERERMRMGAVSATAAAVASIELNWIECDVVVVVVNNKSK